MDTGWAEWEMNVGEANSGKEEEEHGKRNLSCVQGDQGWNR